MILFVPGSDEPTNANLDIGKRLANGHIHLLAEKAIRSNLIELLHELKNESLFSMSHGKSDMLLDNNRETAIGIDDKHLFTNRVVYAWACHTGSNLGKHIADNNGIWWGYTGAVTAPSTSEPFRQKQEEVFRFIQNRFEEARTKEDILKVLNELKDKCDEMLSFFDELQDVYPDEDILEIYSCSNQIWSRLCVWHPSRDEPLMHKESGGLLLDI